MTTDAPEVIAMLGKCANPDCHTQFRFLGDGKLFHLEANQRDAEKLRRVEHYWLCERCAQEFTVVAVGTDKPVVAARPGSASDRGHMRS